MPKVLLQKGANVFFQRDSNFPPLHVVAEYGHFKMPKFLIPKGANVFVSVIAQFPTTSRGSRICQIRNNLIVLFVFRLVNKQLGFLHLKR